MKSASQPKPKFFGIQKIRLPEPKGLGLRSQWVQSIDFSILK